MDERTITPESNEAVSLHDATALQEIPVREGVVLRPMAETDAPAMVVAIDADPSIRDRVTVAARIHKEDDVKQEIIDYKSDPNLIRYAIAEDGQCVGLMSLWRDDGYMTGQAIPNAIGFGFFLNPAARGKGIVTDSLKALSKTAQENLYVEALIAFCEDDNEGSIAALRSIGLEPTEVTIQEPHNGWSERLYEKKLTNGQD